MRRKRAHKPYQRLYVLEYLGENRARWECKDGHRWTGQLMKPWGPPGGRKSLPTADLLRRFARYWAKENGGCCGTCRQCEKEEA